MSGFAILLLIMVLPLVFIVQYLLVTALYPIIKDLLTRPFRSS
jgi:hypothetical protein